VNLAVTIRNRATGIYIRDYEQHGRHCAAYGARLLDSLSERLAGRVVPGLAASAAVPTVPPGVPRHWADTVCPMAQPRAAPAVRERPTLR
jgi:hypothetical protein